MPIIDLENQSTIVIDLSLLEEIAHSVTQREIELIVTDNETIKMLNEEHRGKAQATDVLSFPLESPFEEEKSHSMPLGSIVISEAFVKEKALEFGHSEAAEASLLFIHGLLHLLGYDHEVDRGEMREKEKALIQTFSLPSSLIIRTTEGKK